MDGLGLSISGSSAPQKTSRSGVSPNKAQTRKPVGVSSGYGQQKASTASGPKKTLIRPKTWTPEIEDLYRLQGAGWESMDEYIGRYGEPERWGAEVCENKWISKLQIKQNGFFVYWKKHRECEDGSLNKVKIITYE